jgi:hypothetical protein
VHLHAARVRLRAIMAGEDADHDHA